MHQVLIRQSFIEQDKVGWWVQRYNVPFEVVTVQQERDKRPPWRAKGILPCLILTDKDHVIRWIGTSFKQLQ